MRAAVIKEEGKNPLAFEVGTSKEHLIMVAKDIEERQTWIRDLHDCTKQMQETRKLARQRKRVHASKEKFSSARSVHDLIARKLETAHEDQESSSIHEAFAEGDEKDYDDRDESQHSGSGSMSENDAKPTSQSPRHSLKLSTSIIGQPAASGASPPTTPTTVTPTATPTTPTATSALGTSTPGTGDPHRKFVPRLVERRR